jgi:hypothetical protein
VTLGVEDSVGEVEGLMDPEMLGLPDWDRVIVELRVPDGVDEGQGDTDLVREGVTDTEELLEARGVEVLERVALRVKEGEGVVDLEKVAQGEAEGEGVLDRLKLGLSEERREGVPLAHLLVVGLALGHMETDWVKERVGV